LHRICSALSHSIERVLVTGENTGQMRPRKMPNILARFKWVRSLRLFHGYALNLKEPILC
jgi:hypothetical protein